MSFESIIILNALLYSALLYFCSQKFGLKNFSTFLSFLYAISSWFSYFYFKHPLFDITYVGASFSIDLESIFYLFTVNCLLILPFSNLNLSKIIIHTHLNWKYIFLILKILFIVYCVILLFDIPNIIASMRSSITLSELRDVTYMEGGVNSNIFVISLANRFFGGFKLLFLFLSFYGLIYYEGKKNLFLICIILYTFGIIAVAMQYISRAIVIHFIFELSLCYILFYNDIKAKIKKRIVVFSIVGISLFSVFFAAITMSRFGDSKDIDTNDAVSLSLVRYAGESQLNFCSLLYNRTNDLAWGYDIFPLYRRVLGLEYPSGINREDKVNYMDKKMNCPSYVFYQLAGALYANFGKYGALLISLLFYLGVKSILKFKHSIYYFKLYIVLLLTCVVAKGVFWAHFGTETENLAFVFALILFYYIKDTNKNKSFFVIHHRRIYIVEK